MRAYALIVLFTIIMGSAPAWALSIDRETGMNSDGSAKFNDPDDQAQSLLNTPLTDPSKKSDGSSNGMLAVAPNAHVGVTVNHFGAPQEPDAFDQAFSHK